MSDKKNILCYDSAVLPRGMTIRDVLRNYNELNIIVWCSSANGNFSGKENHNCPQIFNKDEIKEFKFIDTADLTEEQINELKK